MMLRKVTWYTEPTACKQPATSIELLWFKIAFNRFWFGIFSSEPAFADMLIDSISSS